jgi:RsmE family RNA methyltransferase
VNLILLEQEELRDDSTASLSDARATHLRDVLGVKPGSLVRVGIVNGGSGTAAIRSVEPDRVVLQPSIVEPASERPRVDVLLALPRPKVLRRLYAQLAALGVGRIMLTNAARVERHYFDTHILSPGCFRPLLVEGLQQARDTRLPVVTIHRQFRVLVEDELDILAPGTTRVVAEPGAERHIETVVESAAVAERLVLAVGPEGGWNAFELHLLTAHGFIPASMGGRTLRTDTACIALLALAHTALDRRRTPA